MSEVLKHEKYFRKSTRLSNFKLNQNQVIIIVAQLKADNQGSVRLRLFGLTRL